ncbi:MULTISPECIES: structural protein [Proteus]|uniref:structural protein n=1 Tax=Proteus TaxID=583 RepID=UPI001378679D|nr:MULTISPECIES: structural protein [unclassified Proteus (in: enterobacteria)]NBM12304.1 structural protein [Proteus sp. G2670]NBM33002.1 structural protein [Proteus sp. G2664]NBM70117.1 structural protein [Proteus sp. G2663]
MARPARGERNNNPGNIRHGSKWQGLSAQQTDKDFCQFVSPEYGIRAIYKLLQTYQNKYELNTVESIIDRYAPPNENNTVGYINRAAKDIGVSVNEPINVSSKPVAIALATAIVGVELGYQPYSQKVFEDAWLLL